MLIIQDVYSVCLTHRINRPPNCKTFSHLDFPEVLTPKSHTGSPGVLTFGCHKCFIRASITQIMISVIQVYI